MRQKTKNHFLKFSIHLTVRKSRENQRQIYGKSKASLYRNLRTGTPPNCLGQSFALQLQFTIEIFFRTAVLWKLFDIRFSYKHCNFSHICLLVKMASKTVTRSILENYRELHFLPWLNLHIIIIHYYQEYYNETFVFSQNPQARFKRRSTHVPNLTDELNTVKERRLNQFSTAVLV